MELNAGQKIALRQLKETFDKTALSILSGDAGTGKSAVLVELIDQLIYEKVDPARICVAVPTHKLTGEWKIKLEGTGVEIKTVHSLMKFFPDVDDKGERPLRKMSRDTDDAEILPYDVLIVDEAFMLPRQVVQAIYSHGYLPVIFAGDPGQTLPIGESTSELNLLKDYLYLIKLTENMRQTAEDLRQTVESVRLQGREFNPKTKLNRSEFQKAFFKSVEKEPEDTLYLAYRNVNCQKMSDMLRSIQGVTDLDFVEVGEKIKVKSVMHKGRVLIPANTVVEVVKLHKNTNAFDILHRGSTYMVRLDTKKEIEQSLVKAQELNNKKDWKKHYDLCDTFVTFFHPAVSTVHSSQGMTVKNVFLDWTDIKKCLNDPNLAYVAASRSSEKLIFG